MNRGPRHPERAFGISVGGLLCAFTALLIWRGRVPAAVLSGLGGVLLVAFGWLRPRALAIPSRAWWRLVHVLGYVNARIILTLLFAVVIVPLHAGLRLAGRDLLAARRENWPGWMPYPGRYRDRRHYSRMY